MELAEGDAATIGRSHECTIVVDDRTVSRVHAELRRDHGGWSIADMASTGGTFVNGARVGARTPLAEGDVITIGTAQLTVLGDEIRPGLGSPSQIPVLRAAARGTQPPFPVPPASEPDTAQMAAPIETRRPADPDPTTGHQSNGVRRMSTDTSHCAHCGAEISGAQGASCPACQSRQAMTDASRAAAEAQTAVVYFIQWGVCLLLALMLLGIGLAASILLSIDDRLRCAGELYCYNSGAGGGVFAVFGLGFLIALVASIVYGIKGRSRRLKAAGHLKR